MASYSSMDASLQLASLENKLVLKRVCSFQLMPGCYVLKRSVNEVALSLHSKASVRRCSVEKVEKFVVMMSVSQPQGESQAVGAVDTAIFGEKEAGGVAGKNLKIVEDDYELVTDHNGNGGDGFDGNGGNGGFSNGRGGHGGGGGGGDEGNDKEEEEFGPIMKFEEVMRETKARGASLPPDMLEAAKSVGLRKVLLERFLDLQVGISRFLVLLIHW